MIEFTYEGVDGQIDVEERAFEYDSVDSLFYELESVLNQTKFETEYVIERDHPAEKEVELPDDEMRANVLQLLREYNARIR